MSNLTWIPAAVAFTEDHSEATPSAWESFLQGLLAPAAPSAAELSELADEIEATEPSYAADLRAAAALA